MLFVRQINIYISIVCKSKKIKEFESIWNLVNDPNKAQWTYLQATGAVKQWPVAARSFGHWRKKQRFEQEKDAGQRGQTKCKWN